MYVCVTFLKFFDRSRIFKTYSDDLQEGEDVIAKIDGEWILAQVSKLVDVNNYCIRDVDDERFWPDCNSGTCPDNISWLRKEHMVPRRRIIALPHRDSDFVAFEHPRSTAVLVGLCVSLCQGARFGFCSLAMWHGLFGLESTRLFGAVRVVWLSGHHKNMKREDIKKKKRKSELFWMVGLKGMWCFVGDSGPC